MTPEMLAKIKARAEGATAKWAVRPNGQELVVVIEDDGRGWGAFEQFEQEAAANLSFIAHARDDVSALVALVGRMLPLVRAVAAKGGADAHGVSGLIRCTECGVVGHATLAHHAGCLAEQARALLAETEVSK